MHDLQLADDRVLITRILPLVTGSLLRFLGGCLGRGISWADYKTQLLHEYFPHFVRKSLIRDLVVFNFQGGGSSVRVYIKQAFRGEDFLQYEANEHQLVDRVVMNSHL